jgi:prepilin-type N-terminal cleavage/methylation domain-containing protein
MALMFTVHGPMLKERRISSVRSLQRFVRSGGGGLRNGFTLIELLVAVVIFGVLAGMGMAAFNVANTGSEANALLTTLRYARSIAVKQGTPVIVCPSANPNAVTPTCVTGGSGTSWKTGWVVLVPSLQSGANSGCADLGVAGDQWPQIQTAFTNKDTAITKAGNSVFCFNRNGFMAATYDGYVQFDTTPVKVANRRCVMVESVGHIQVVSSGQTDATGSATCP